MNENLLPAFLTVREASKILNVDTEILFRLAAEEKVTLGADPFLLLLGEGKDPNFLKELFSSFWLKSEADMQREERKKSRLGLTVFDLAEMPDDPEPLQDVEDLIYISKDEVLRLKKSDAEPESRTVSDAADCNIEPTKKATPMWHIELEKIIVAFIEKNKKSPNINSVLKEIKKKADDNSSAVFQDVETSLTCPPLKVVYIKNKKTPLTQKSIENRRIIIIKSLQQSQLPAGN